MSGTCTEHRDNRSHQIEQPGLSLNHPGLVQGIQVHGKELTGLEIGFEPDWFENISDKAVHLKKPMHQVRLGNLPYYAGKILNELKSPDSLSAFSLESSVTELIVELERSCAGKETYRPAWLKKVVNQILENPAQEFSLTELAQETGSHPVHLSRSFKQYTGQTLTGFIRQTRLNQSLALLRQQESTIAQVALACGFYDQSHFHRLFTQQFGLTPSQYRSQTVC